MSAKQTRSCFYAVRSGREPGIYATWDECAQNVKGYKGAIFKKFKTEAEAKEYARLPANRDFVSRPSSNSLSEVYKSQQNSNSTTTISKNREVPKIKAGPRNVIKGYITVSKDSRITPQVAKRKLSDSEYEREYKHRKSESAALLSKEKTTVVYTDGASSNNGRGNASAGFGVYWGENDPRNASVKLPGKLQTNQRAEASAVIHALEQSIDGTDTLEIRTDSQYVINAATDWSKKWIINNWRSSNGKEVQNRDLFEKMLNLMDRRKGKVKFEYVPGHQGVEGNEKADRLAVAGAKK